MKRVGLQFIRPLVPGSWAHWWRRRFGWQWFRGDHPDWAAARAAAAGYDDAAVLARVLAATREVRAGKAKWERDGVAFTTPAINEPLLAALREAAQLGGEPLMVVDFGGSLGSTWWQHRRALADLPGVQWRVVEQAHYVAAGGEFADAQLSFHGSMAGARAGGRASVLLLSSVLPYVESPFAVLEEAVRLGFREVIIDRTPLVRSGRTRLAVQYTPPALGGGSYPCWLLERGQLIATLRENYRLVREWPALDDLAPDVAHRGFHFRRREP